MNIIELAQNYTMTENGAIAHKSTTNPVLDLFAMGGAYRDREENECYKLFSEAFNENERLAMKCLFYLRNPRGGQGERRFFKVILKRLAKEHPEAVKRNIEYIPILGRWDDLYALDGTPCERLGYQLMKTQYVLDKGEDHPSLLAKWLKSENASSKESRTLGTKTRKMFGTSAEDYRKTLSDLRKKIKIVENNLRTENYSAIEYTQLPSKAGFKYRKAFARNDYERYSDFIHSEKKAHASVLYPYEITKKCNDWMSMSSIERDTLNKYWNSLNDVIQGANVNGICVVDVSGSMSGRPMDVATSLGLYCAERANGPYHNKFITFSDYPEIVEVEGNDIVEKVNNMKNADWESTTNIESVFDLLLNTATKYNVDQKDVPENLFIISDMEFNECAICEKETRAIRREWWEKPLHQDASEKINTLMDTMKEKWEAAGYRLPNLVFWNVNARQNNIPMLGERVSYVSGFSPNIFKQIITGKTGYELMMETIGDGTYDGIE